MTTLPTSRAMPDQYYVGEPEPSGGLSSMLTIATVRGIIYRQRYMLIGIIGLALVGSLVLTLLTQPLYQASATVRIDPYAKQVVEGQDLEPATPANDIFRYMQTQGSVINSRRIAYSVVDALKLDTRADFIGELATVRPEGMNDKEWARARREAAAGEVNAGTRAEVPMDNRIITISFVSPDPRLAAEIANGLAESFVQDDVRVKLESNAYAQKYIKTQIDKLQMQVQQAEVAANNYARLNGIISQAVSSSSADGGEVDSAPTITIANLVSVNEAYTIARNKRIAAEERWKAIAGIPVSQLPEVQQNATIQGMVTERSKAMAELSQLRQRYGETYPQVRELTAQVASLTTQINRAGAEVKNAIRDEYLVAQRQEDALKGERGSVSGQTLEEQDKRVRYNMLNREAVALRTQLESLLDRYNQIASAANLQPGTSSLLDAARVPGGPVSPNLAKNLLIGLTLGIAAALAIAILREAFDDRLRTTDDVERKLGLPLLGYTPDISERDLDDEVADPFSTLMEAYSSIRTSIDFAIPGNNRVIQITSSQRSEGKSLTSMVLARKYAQLGRKTLLIDADLRKPSIAALFGVSKSSAGFVEVLLGDVPMRDALLKDTPDNLDVLPAGQAKVNPVELLSSQVLIDFVEQQRQHYSLIIFDSVPVMGLADAPLLSRLADSTVFIVEANRAHFGQAKTAIRRLVSASARVAGVVLTKYRAAEAGMDYNYHYQYYAYGDKTKKS